MVFWGIRRKRGFCFNFEDVTTGCICSFQNSFSVLSVSNPQSRQVTSPEEKSLVLQREGWLHSCVETGRGFPNQITPMCLSTKLSDTDLTFILIIFHNTNKVASQLSLQVIFYIFLFVKSQSLLRLCLSIASKFCLTSSLLYHCGL